MTHSQAALSSLTLLLALSATAFAERQVVTVPAAPAPPLDGKLADAAWEKSVAFEIVRDDETYAKVRLLRSGRELIIGYRSAFKPLALGVRFHFTDPETGRTVALLISPLEMPRAPLSAWLTRRGGGTTRLDASRSQLGFDFSPDEGFTFVASVPLDLLEIGRPKKTFRFNVELWDTEARRPLAFYPGADSSVGAQQPAAIFEPAKDWGIDVPADAPEPPVNDAIAVLQEIAAGGNKTVVPVTEGEKPMPQGDGISAHMGHTDGKRNDGALAKLEKRLRAQLPIHPNYAALYGNLVRVLVGRNEPTQAFEIISAMRSRFPSLTRDPRQVLGELQLLRDSGQYAAALAWLKKQKPLMGELPAYARESQQLATLDAAWTAEEAYRAADAKRDDLPRVRVETDRGAFVLELFEDDAPNTVANFIQLVGRGFYDGTRFHWAVASASVFGGDANSRDDDPYNDGFGDPGYLIEPEQNRRANFPYTIAMVPVRRSQWKLGSNFAIHLAPALDRDGRMTVFGRVIEGLEVVRRLSHSDAIKKATVIRKRDHAYTVVKRPKK